VDYHNIRSAFLGAIRGNRESPSVINFCRNTAGNLSVIREKLSSLECGWGGYHSFVITDPKLRVISTASIEQRIMHHAIIDPLIPVFERPMIYHSYACRKGKGTHAALLHAFGQCKAHARFLKLDIRAYFDSIHHDTLKAQLHRLIKDTRVMVLLRGIIDSYETAPGKGVPIGNLTSQYFANMYLSGLDHLILEQLRPAGCCRYMDDFVLWAATHTELKTMLAAIDTYVTASLRLTLKQPVFGNSARGLPFLGFLIKKEGIYLMKKSKRRVQKRMAEIDAAFRGGSISEAKAAERARSVFAAISLARTNRLRKNINSEPKIRGNGLWLQPRETRRVVEQQREERAFLQPEQQPWLPAGSPLSFAE
jgi:hypothetical protein